MADCKRKIKADVWELSQLWFSSVMKIKQEPQPPELVVPQALHVLGSARRLFLKVTFLAASSNS